MFIFLIAFIVAASFGAFLRLQASQWIVAPWGTLAVNVIGSLAIGFLAVYLAKYSPQTKTIILIALLGSLTTFSSYSLELVRLFEDGSAGKAFLYLVSSNALCFGACYFGWKIAQSMVISS